MATEVEQAIFYQIRSFLKQNETNWFTNADTNGDGYLINYEFSQYIINKFKDWNGQESNKIDIINQFWKQFDANRSASHIKKTDGKDTNLRNINALDTSEKTKLDNTVKNTTVYKVDCNDQTSQIYVGDNCVFNPKVTDEDNNDVAFTLKLANGSNGTLSSDGKSITVSTENAGTYAFTAFVCVGNEIVGQITKKIEVKNRYSCNFTDDDGKTLSIDNVTMDENTKTSFNISLKDNKAPNSTVSVTKYDITSNNSALKVTASNGKLTLEAGEVDEDTSVTVKVEATVGNTKVTTSFTVTIKNKVIGKNPTTSYIESAKTIVNKTDWPETVQGYIGTGYNAEIHTEFGMNTNGEIDFENKDTTTKYYDSLVSKIQTKIKASCPTEYTVLGGDAGIKKLVQAAWIMTYNDFNSSTEHSTKYFIEKVISNFKNILNNLAASTDEDTAKIKLDIYTSHSSYADTSLTDDLPNYDVPFSIVGRNGKYYTETIYYENWSKDEKTGGVNTGGGRYGEVYEETMSSLLKKLQNKYSSIDAGIIETLFNQAQYNALTVCKDNSCDCPYGTGNNGSNVEDGDNKDWGGSNRRKGDDYLINMDEFVQLTLYQFDKLLYAWIVNEYDKKSS